MASSNISSSSLCNRSYFLFAFWLGLAFEINLQMTFLFFSVVVGIGTVVGISFVVIVVCCCGFFGSFFGLLVMAFGIVSTIS